MGIRSSSSASWVRFFGCLRLKSKSGIWVGEVEVDGVAGGSNNAPTEDGGGGGKRICDGPDLRDFLFFDLMMLWSPLAAIGIDKGPSPGTRSRTCFGKAVVGGFTDTSDAGIDVSAKDDGTSGAELRKSDLRDFFFFGLMMFWSPSAAIGIDERLSS